jgi:hypothetical protein
MPTGYTSAVADGEVTEFRDFALQCARAFGALIEMRDDSADAPLRLPRESDYYEREVKETEARLANLHSMTTKEINEAAAVAYAAAVKRVEGYNAERRTTKERYEAMLAHVAAWKPPSPDHHELKQFMRQQLQQSIDFDCRCPTPLPAKRDAEEWWRDEIKNAERSLKSAAESAASERARVSGRRAWIQSLLASLGLPPLTENVLPLARLDALQGDDEPGEAA